MKNLLDKSKELTLCDRIEITSDDLAVALKTVLGLKSEGNDYDTPVAVYPTDDGYVLSENDIIRREARHLLKLFEKDYVYDRIDNLSAQNAEKKFNFERFLSNISIPPIRPYAQKNIQSRNGERASELVHFGPFHQYAIIAYHTNEYDDVLWRVYDVHSCDPDTGYFPIIRYSTDFDLAYEGLDLSATTWT